MNENESIKYNKEILTTKIQFRIVLMLGLLGILLLCIFVFKCNDNMFSTLLGGIISLFLTAIYSFVDLFIKIFKEIDKERTQFISVVYDKHNKYNKDIKDMLDKIEEGEEGISKIDPMLAKREKINKILNSKLNDSKTYSYIIELYWLIKRSQNIYTYYSQTEEYKQVIDYIEKVFIWINSFIILKRHDKVKIEKINVQDRFISIKIGRNDELYNAIIKANAIIKKEFEEIDIMCLKYFTNEKPGNILLSYELSIDNKIAIAMHDLLNMDIKKHKEESWNIFAYALWNSSFPFQNIIAMLNMLNVYLIIIISLSQ